MPCLGLYEAGVREDCPASVLRRQDSVAVSRRAQAERSAARQRIEEPSVASGDARFGKCPLERERLEAILRAAPRMTVALVGDLFLDRYLHLVPGAREWSVETGLEAYQVEQVRNVPGALGTVMNNLAALGVGLLVPVSVVGDDGHGYDLLREVRKLPVDLAHLLCLPERLTPTYTKPLALQADGTWKELNRLDVRTRRPLSEAATAELMQRIVEVFHSSDGMVVLDQLVDADQGVVNRSVRRLLAALGREHPEKLLLVDSRGFLGKFEAAMLKGNRGEVVRAAAAEHASGHPSSVRQAGAEGEAPLDLVEAALAGLASKTGRPAFCTLGSDGILVAPPSGPSQRVPAVPVAGPIDIVGAGDAATSGLVLAMLAGASPVEAAALANLVASITIQQLGTTGTASPDQIRQRWEACAAASGLA
jgi:bifunctional ADP-heptose synthase (sugar kinase/adenylyltransferase)